MEEEMRRKLRKKSFTSARDHADYVSAYRLLLPSPRSVLTYCLDVGLDCENHDIVDYNKKEIVIEIRTPTPTLPPIILHPHTPCTGRPSMRPVQKHLAQPHASASSKRISLSPSHTTMYATDRLVQLPSRQSPPHRLLPTSEGTCSYAQMWRVGYRRRWRKFDRYRGLLDRHSGQHRFVLVQSARHRMDCLIRYVHCHRFLRGLGDSVTSHFRCGLLKSMRKGQDSAEERFGVAVFLAKVQQ